MKLCVSPITIFVEKVGGSCPAELQKQAKAAQMGLGCQPAAPSYCWVLPREGLSAVSPEVTGGTWAPSPFTAIEFSLWNPAPLIRVPAPSAVQTGCVEIQGPRAPLQLPGTAATCPCGQTQALLLKCSSFPCSKSHRAALLCYPSLWSDPRSSSGLCCTPRVERRGRSSAQGWVLPHWCQRWSCALLGVSTRRFVSSGAADGRGDIAGERSCTHGHRHSQSPRDRNSAQKLCGTLWSNEDKD